MFFLTFLSRVRLKMLVSSSPTQETYTRSNPNSFSFQHVWDFFQNHPQPIRKRPQRMPKHLPTCSNVHVKVTPI